MSLDFHPAAEPREVARQLSFTLAKIACKQLKHEGPAPCAECVSYAGATTAPYGGVLLVTAFRASFVEGRHRRPEALAAAGYGLELLEHYTRNGSARATIRDMLGVDLER